jgi:hypothetical protein
MTRTFVLVEGASDAIALETVARRRGRDLAAENMEVVAMDGVTNVRRHLEALPEGARATGLCDGGERRTFERAFDANTRRLNVLGCFVCDPDLESELIRAVGLDRMLDVIASQGELESFRTLQRQPAHRDRDVAQQLHRFIGSKSGRKLRYARLLAEAIELAAVPRPLYDVLSAGEAAVDLGAHDLAVRRGMIEPAEQRAREIVARE